MARNPGRRSISGNPTQSTRYVGSHAPLSPQRLPIPARIAVTVVISVTVIVGGVTLGLKISSSAGATTEGPATRGSGEHLSVTAESAQASIKRTTVALSASGYGGYLAPEADDNCASHSYGQVQLFFRSNPCRWLVRSYIVVRINKQDLALVAISWVDMPTSSMAEKYKHLVDTPGTGNITELSRDSGPYKDIQFTGKYYLSGIVGTAVWNVQVQPVGAVATNVLKEILNDSRQ